MVEVRLHLGAAKRRLKGFLNVDREASDGVDLVTDVKDLSAFADSSVAEIYSSHTLEYFDRDEVRDVLAEWNRVLTPGGKLNVTVPDLNQLIKIYGQTKDISRILGPLFGKWHNPINGETLYHRTVWDFASLKMFLENSGFASISTFDPVDYLGSIDKNFDDYSLAYFPHMDRNGIPISLSVQAIKMSLG
jgi:predicted SAM-dependent methyltransferase